jgi:hypothetical protein
VFRGVAGIADNVARLVAIPRCLHASDGGRCVRVPVEWMHLGPTKKGGGGRSRFHYY